MLRISTLKTACPISGQEGLEELERSAASLEEKSYAAANSQVYISESWSPNFLRYMYAYFVFVN